MEPVGKPRPGLISPKTSLTRRLQDCPAVEEGVPQQALVAAVQVAVHGIESEVTNSVLH